MRVNLIIGQGTLEQIQAAVTMFRTLAFDIPVSSNVGIYSSVHKTYNMSLECDHTILPNVTNIAIESLADNCKQDWNQ